MLMMSNRKKYFETGYKGENIIEKNINCPSCGIGKLNKTDKQNLPWCDLICQNCYARVEGKIKQEKFGRKIKCKCGNPENLPNDVSTYLIVIKYYPFGNKNTFRIFTLVRPIRKEDIEKFLDRKGKVRYQLVIDKTEFLDETKNLSMTSYN